MGKESVQYVIDGKNLLSKKLTDIDKDANRTEQNINNIGRGGIGGGSGGGNLFKSIVGGNLLARGIEAGTSAIYNFGKESIQAFGKFEQFQTALTTMFHGNKIEARALSDELVQFAKSTPFELTEIQDATKQLIAYGSTSGSVGKELKMLGDISSGVGAPIGEIAYLYGTARTQGRLFARDIYQLSGRGIPIIAALAKQFKVSESAVMGLVEKGKVGFGEMQKAMQSMTAEGGQFAGMMDAQSKTVLGKWSNMQDAIDQLKVGLGNSQQGLIHAALDFSTKFVSGLADSIKYTNDLNDKLSALHVQLKFGENVDALKGGRDLSGNMSAQALARVDKANQQSIRDISQFRDFLNRTGDSKDGKKLADEFLKASVSEIDRRNSENLLSRNRMNRYDPTQAGINNTEFIRLYAINEDAKNKLKQIRDSFFNKGKPSGTSDGSGKTTGTGTTIEAGTPKNMYINITNFLPDWKVDGGNEPKSLAIRKEEVGRAFLELVNDAYLAQR